VSELEALISRAEGTEAARGFSSGMGAICGAVLPFLRAGQRRTPAAATKWRGFCWRT